MPLSRHSDLVSYHPPTPVPSRSRTDCNIHTLFLVILRSYITRLPAEDRVTLYHKYIRGAILSALSDPGGLCMSLVLIYALYDTKCWLYWLQGGNQIGMIEIWLDSIIDWTSFLIRSAILFW